MRSPNPNAFTYTAVFCQVPLQTCLNDHCRKNHRLLSAEAEDTSVAHSTRVIATLAASQTLHFVCGGPNTDFEVIRTHPFPVTPYHLLVLLQQRAGEIKLRTSINRSQSESRRDSTDELHNSRLNRWKRVGDCGVVSNC